MLLLWSHERTLGNGYAEEEQAQMRGGSIFRWLGRRKYGLLGVMLATLLLLSGWHGWQSSRQACVKIRLNDAQASQGLLPDQTAFFPYSMISEDILQQAIDSLGWQQLLTAEELSNSLSLRPIKAGQSGEETISTVYELSLDLANIPGMSGRAETLLDAVCAEIRTYFEAHRPSCQTFLSFQLTGSNENGLRQTEPYLYLDTLTLRARQLSQYVNERLVEGGFFAVQGDFSAHETRLAVLKSDLNGMLTYDLPAVKVLVTQNGVAQDAAWLARLLTYQNQRRNAVIQQNMSVYTANQNGIAQYGAFVTATALIPTLDEAGAYYLSGTKTAVDDMARAAEEALQEATELQLVAAETETMLERLQAAPDEAAATVADVQQRLTQLASRLDDIAQELCTMEQTEAALWAETAVVFERQERSWATRIALKRTLAETGGLLLVTVFCMRQWDRRKGQKGAARHEGI